MLRIEMCATKLSTFLSGDNNIYMLYCWYMRYWQKKSGFKTKEEFSKWWSNYQKKRRAKFQSMGICRSCCKRKAVKERTMCKECLFDRRFSSKMVRSIFGSGRDVAHIRDGASYPKLFEFTNQCLNPALTKLQILDWALFNMLIFNYDAHSKNISFFVGPNGTTLAPFYDVPKQKRKHIHVR